MSKIEDNILKVAKNEFNYFMDLKNVIGVGLGKKNKNGIIIDEPCIHVLVKEKINEKFINKNNIIPKKYKGLKTDVIEVGECFISQGNAIPNVSRPLEGGCGISAVTNALLSGTLGCIVYRKNKEGEREYFILANNHVLTNNQTAALGTPIIQPSFFNGGKISEDVVAYLADYVMIKPINPNEADNLKQPPNKTDCAIARIYNTSWISSSIIQLGKIKGTNKPLLNMDVKKVGFISGLKKGFITTIGLSLKIRIINDKVSLMTEQCLLNINNAPGDSGCVVLNDNNEVVGLTFGATKSGSAIMNDINIVLKQLKVKIYTTETLV